MEMRASERAEKMEERMSKRLKEREEKEVELAEYAERREKMEGRNNNLAKRSEKRLKELEKKMKLREMELAKRSKELAKMSKNRSISRSRSGNTNSFTYSSNGEGVENAVMIDKDTSDATLEKIKTKLAAKGITFNYSKVKRNSQGEITRIKITTNNGKGSKSTITSNADDGEAIDDILIEI